MSRKRSSAAQTPPPEDCAVSVRGKIQTLCRIEPKTPNQKLYLDSIRRNTFTLALGSPGVGKTLLAFYAAAAYFNSEKSPIERILYVRANVEMWQERSLGALPGNMNDKMYQLTRPAVDNLIKFMAKRDAEALVKSEKLECIPVSTARGRTFDRTFIIVDEAQNMSPDVVKALITRVGEDSKFVLMGDPRQCDVRPGVMETDGLSHAFKVLEGLEDFGFIKFTYEDIVRNPRLSAILQRYERD